MSATITNKTIIPVIPTTGTVIPNTLPLEPAYFSITQDEGNPSLCNIVLKVFIDSTINPKSITLETDGKNFYINSPTPTTNPPANFTEYLFNIYSYPCGSLKKGDQVLAFNNYILPNGMAQKTEPAKETTSPPFEGTVQSGGAGDL